MLIRYFQVVFTALLACAAAAPGLISPYASSYAAPYAAPYASYASPYASPYAAPWGNGLVGAPLVGAPVVKTVAPVATSYANTVRVRLI